MFLQSFKSLLHCSIHSKSFDPLKASKNWMLWSVDSDMKWLSATMHLVSFWTSLMLRGGFMSKSDVIFSGFTSIPLSWMIKLRNFLAETLKVHFKGLCFMRSWHSISKDLCPRYDRLFFNSLLIRHRCKPPSWLRASLQTSYWSIFSMSLQPFVIRKASLYNNIVIGLLLMLYDLGPDHT